jgi:hypothetical protein
MKADVDEAVVRRDGRDDLVGEAVIGGRGGRFGKPVRDRALIADSRTGSESAKALGISEKTVARHRANILLKLGLRDRVALTRYAIRRGLIKP